jgi:cytochrome c556
MISLYRALAAAALLIVLAASGLAHEGATGVAKRLNANRDLAGIAGDADHISDVVSRISPLFPPGSDKGITDAKPAIWQQWDEFVGDERKLGDEAKKLSSLAASGDTRALADQYRTVAKACIACHDSFRRGRADKL